VAELTIISVEGIEETCRYLEEVAETVAIRGYVAGLDAAGEVFESALWPRVPIDLGVLDNAAHGGKGALAANLRRSVDVDAHGRGGIVDVGFGQLGHIALWVEFGHNQVLRQGIRGKAKILGFTPAHPFMRTAFDASKEQAIDAFIEGVKTALKTISGYTAA